MRLEGRRHGGMGAWGHGGMGAWGHGGMGAWGHGGMEAWGHGGREAGKYYLLRIYLNEDDSVLLPVILNK